MGNVEKKIIDVDYEDVSFSDSKPFQKIKQERKSKSFFKKMMDNIASELCKFIIRILLFIAILGCVKHLILPKFLNTSIQGMEFSGIENKIKGFPSSFDLEEGKLIDVNGKYLTVNIKGTNKTVRVASVSDCPKDTFKNFLGKTVYLEKDTTDISSDGALYRHVWLTKNISTPLEESFSGFALKNKKAKPEIYQTDLLYSEDLVKIYESNKK